MTQSTVEEKIVREGDLTPLVLDLVGDVRAERDRLLEELHQAELRLAAQNATNSALEAALTLAKKQLEDKTALSAENAESQQDHDEAHDRELTAARNRNAALQKELATATKKASKCEVELAETKQALQKSRKHAAAMEDKLARKTVDHNRAMELLYERTDERDKAADRATAHEQAIEDLKRSLGEAKQKRATLEKELADANKKVADQSSREVKAAPRVINVDGADMEGVRRHLETARVNFEENPDKCLRALNRAHAILTTSAEKEGDDRGNE